MIKPMNEPESDEVLVYGNPMNGFHVVSIDYPYDTLCGDRPPLDQTTMTTFGHPTCDKCIALLAEQAARS